MQPGVQRGFGVSVPCHARQERVRAVARDRTARVQGWHRHQRGSTSGERSPRGMERSPLPDDAFGPRRRRPLRGAARRDRSLPASVALRRAGSRWSIPPVSGSFSADIGMSHAAPSRTAPGMRPSRQRSRTQSAPRGGRRLAPNSSAVSHVAIRSPAGASAASSAPPTGTDAMLQLWVSEGTCLAASAPPREWSTSSGCVPPHRGCGRRC